MYPCICNNNSASSSILNCEPRFTILTRTNCVTEVIALEKWIERFNSAAIRELICVSTTLIN